MAREFPALGYPPHEVVADIEKFAKAHRISGVFEFVPIEWSGIICNSRDEKSKRRYRTRERVANQAAGGQSEKPCPNNPLNDHPFHTAETFHRAYAHDRSGDYMRGGERNAVITGCLNDERGARLCRESMHGLQFHHAVTECADDAPTTRGGTHRHGRGAETYDPGGQSEGRSSKKTQPAGQMIEASPFCAGKKSERDDAHGFLGVIATVAMRHPSRAEDLQFAKKRLHKIWRKAMQRDKKQKHQERAENKACEWGDDHGHNYFWPHTRVPFYDRPTAAGRGHRRPAKSADERVTRTRGQTEPPGRDVPGERSDDRAKHRGHRDHVCVHQPLANGRCNGAAEERAGEIEECGHCNRLTRRKDFGRHHGGDRIRGVVKAVAVFKNDRRENDGKKGKHQPQSATNT